MSEKNPWEKVFNQQRALFELYKIPNLNILNFASVKIPQVQIPKFDLGPWHRISEKMALIVEPMQRISDFFNRFTWVEEAGWIMHETMPTEVHDGADIPTTELDALIENHYRQNWGHIAEDLATGLNDLDLDDEAKKTFAEALTAHEQVLFRVPPRLLYPEIERITRIEIYNGRMDKMASLDLLREQLKEYSIHDLSGDDFLGGLRFYLKLEEHMYSPAKNPDLLAKIQSDPVPNRHAAVHGYVSYNTHKSSINSILVAHFMYRLIALVKGRLELNER